MKKGMALYLVLLFCVAACRNSENTAQFRALNESLQQYSKNLDARTQLIYIDLEGKSKDPQTTHRATLLKAKTDLLKQMADSMRGYINHLKTRLKKEAGIVNDSISARSNDTEDIVERLFEKQGGADSLYQRLSDFNGRTLSLLDPGEFKDNPILQQDIQKSKEQFRQCFPLNMAAAREQSADGKRGSTANPLADYFRHTGVQGAISMLYKLQADITMTENMIADYCNSSVSHPYHGIHSYTPLASMSSSYLKAGQPFDITVGIGDFITTANPTIIVAGDTIPMSVEGVAVYHATANGKPGKHVIPLTMTYYRPDGMPVTVSKKFEYIIRE